MAHDERRTSGFGRLFASLARAAALPDTEFGTVPTAARASLGDQPEHGVPRADRADPAADRRDRRRGDPGPGGGHRAARPPGALHVRLDGPLEGRVQRAVGLEGVDEEQARKLAAETDRAREGYVKHFYKCDARDARHYHLVLDSTALEFDTCADLIVAAARARIVPTP